jgi:hypothetical protein
MHTQLKELRSRVSGGTKMSMVVYVVAREKKK